MAGVGLRPSHPQIRWRRFGDTILLLDHRRGTQQELQRRAGTGLDGSQHERECSGDGRKDKDGLRRYRIRVDNAPAPNTMARMTRAAAWLVAPALHGGGMRSEVRDGPRREGPYH